jgi:glucose-6-phosphate dehydrogenase assembly protein OpcA
MATETIKSASYLLPAANTLSTLYTVPSSTQAVVSTINVCNTASADATYRIAIVPNGVSITNANYIVFNATISGNETIAFTQGITMDSGDLLRVFASSASVAFNAFKMEIS